MTRAQTYIRLFALVGAMGAVGNIDYADALEREAIEKVSRPIRMWLLDNSTQPASLETCRRYGILEPDMTVNKQLWGTQWWERMCLQFGTERPNLGHKCRKAEFKCKLDE